MTGLPRDTAAEIAERLRVFAQPQRLMILATLLNGEQSVGAIDAATGIGQPALSQQLAELRRASLVTQRRIAKTVVYKLADPRTEALVRILTGLRPAAGEEEDILRPNAPMAAFIPPTGDAAMFAVVDKR